MATAFSPQLILSSLLATSFQTAAHGASLASVTHPEKIIIYFLAYMSSQVPVIG